MAIGNPSVSPAVVTREIDLTNGVPNASSSTGAMVGNFRWGPVDQPILVSNEGTLVSVFGNPSDETSVDFHTASYFLKYSNSLQVVREVYEAGTEATATAAVDSDGLVLTLTVSEGGEDYVAAPAVTITAADSGDTPTLTATISGGAVTALTVTPGATPFLYNSNPTITISGGQGSDIVNAYGADTARTPTSIPLVKNDDNWDVQESTLKAASHEIIARYPGALGNSLKVEVCSDTGFAAWAFKGEFDAAPGLSPFASNVGATGTDEVHVAVIDEDGVISGTKGKVLETFAFVSVATNAKTSNGSGNYILDVINRGSAFIHMANIPGVVTPTQAVNGVVHATFTGAAKAISLTNGSDSRALGTAQYISGFDQFADKDTTLVDFLIAPGMALAADQTTVVNDLVAKVQGTNGRKDCVVIASPNRNSVVGVAKANINAAIIANVSFTRSSYLVVDNNYLKVYDKFNDKYIYIPAASSTAGIMASTDLNAAAWYSPAGTRRGQYLGVTGLSYNASKTERDELYKAGINPVANIPGNGVLLFGDKTHLNRPSAFDRINVRRLFLLLERSIAAASQNILFEFNDEFTRAEFLNIVEPVLRDIKGRRGITDFSVICDETNNTGEIIDANQFVASMFIKPARSINFITLNFVAVRSGVSFEEVVGAA